MDTAVPNIAIKLPDGSVRSFPRGVSGTDIAAAIGPGLAKNALTAMSRTSTCRSSTTPMSPLSPAPRPRRWS